jgi:aryl-alcohol dehydrogenase-like predicted oxidoreductase
MVTPAEEVRQTKTALVRAGKIRYWGLSNAHAWYITKLATLATVHGLPAPISLQFDYCLSSAGSNTNISARRRTLASDCSRGARWRAAS